jgi:hypothetical protein
MKITIIGKGTGWELAPLSGETLGITQLILRRLVARVIDMNDYSLWGEAELAEAIKARKVANDLSIPYIDRENYPLQKIIKKFGTDYFSSTADYAIALCIDEGYTEIDLYGVNMSDSGEYAYQKPGVDFWCGMAMGRGIKVNVFGRESRIMKTRDNKLYGYGIPQGGLCERR